MKAIARIFGQKHAVATDAETRVARHLLSGNDPRLGLLAEQLESAPVRRTSLDPTAIAVSPEYTTQDSRFPFELVRLDSPWVPITDAETGRKLEFRVSVARGGFLRALEGRTADGGRWPARWTPDVVGPLEPALSFQLPSADVIDAQRMRARDTLEAWLNRSIASSIETFTPATSAQIAGQESLVGGQFPAALREFYLITDGLESAEFRFLGHRDAYRVDSTYLAALLLAWDSDDRDDFVVVASLGGNDDAVYRLDVHVDVPVPERIAADVREYLSLRLPA